MLCLIRGFAMLLLLVSQATYIGVFSRISRTERLPFAKETSHATLARGSMSLCTVHRLHGRAHIASSLRSSTIVSLYLTVGISRPLAQMFVGPVIVFDRGVDKYTMAVAGKWVIFVASLSSLRFRSSLWTCQSAVSVNDGLYDPHFDMSNAIKASLHRVCRA